MKLSIVQYTWTLVVSSTQTLVSKTFPPRGLLEEIADSKVARLELLGMPQSKEVLSETEGGPSPGDGAI